MRKIPKWRRKRRRRYAPNELKLILISY